MGKRQIAVIARNRAESPGSVASGQLPALQRAHVKGRDPITAITCDHGDSGDLI